jgi:hypothetical protein
MIAPAQKAILVEKLADLLGFHDGADDVLEHLLNIESQEVNCAIFVRRGYKQSNCKRGVSSKYFSNFSRTCWIT